MIIKNAHFDDLSWVSFNSFIFILCLCYLKSSGSVFILKKHINTTKNSPKATQKAIRPSTGFVTKCWTMLSAKWHNFAGPSRATVYNFYSSHSKTTFMFRSSRRLFVDEKERNPRLEKLFFESLHIWHG